MYLFPIYNNLHELKQYFLLLYGKEKTLKKLEGKIIEQHTACCVTVCGWKRYLK